MLDAYRLQVSSKGFPTKIRPVGRSAEAAAVEAAERREKELAESDGCVSESITSSVLSITCFRFAATRRPFLLHAHACLVDSCAAMRLLPHLRVRRSPVRHRC